MIAIYDGDTFISNVDTYEEAADVLDVKVDTAKWMSTKSAHRRNCNVLLYDYGRHDAEYYEM